MFKRINCLNSQFFFFFFSFFSRKWTQRFNKFSTPQYFCNKKVKIKALKKRRNNNTIERRKFIWKIATFSNILSVINTSQLEICIIGICRNVINGSLVVNDTKSIQEEVREIAIDGKAIRSTNNHGNPEKALQIVTAYDVNKMMMIWQTEIKDKTKEDNCSVKSENTQRNLNALRKLAISLHKAYILNTNPKRKTIISSIRNCLTNDKKLEDFLNKSFFM